MESTPEYEIKTKKEQKVYLLSVRYFPFWSVYVITISLLSQYFYYATFNIDITQYLTISEIALGSVSNWVLIVIALLVPSLFVISMSLFHQITINPEEERKPLKHKNIIGLTLLISAGVMFIYVCIFQHSSPSIIIIFLIISFLILSAVAFAYNHRKLKSSKYINIILILIFSGLLSIGTSINGAVNKMNDYHYGTTIVTKDSSFVNTNDHFFVGKTERFVFIYNRPTQSSLVIPMEEVKKIEIYQFSPFN
jgi:hypothetical protein